MAATDKCGRYQTLLSMRDSLASNFTLWDEVLAETPECVPRNNITPDAMVTDYSAQSSHEWDQQRMLGRMLYAYITPALIVIGLTGNGISMKIFCTERMRRSPSSLYLLALSVSDNAVLIVYVFLEWLNKGFPYLPSGRQISVINLVAVCRLFLYFSYTFRFISVWIIVTFTIERYIAVCHPMHQRAVCTCRWARRLILAVVVMGLLLSLYKPLTGGVYHLPTADGMGLSEVNGSHDDVVSTRICTRNPDRSGISSRFDIAYGFSITVLPMIPVFLFNLMILRRIRRATPSNKIPVTVNVHRKGSRLRTEMTLTLLLISVCFLVFNLPYLVSWCKKVFNSHRIARDLANAMLSDDSDQIYFTKTIFNFNYAINFFLYCLAGTYYRRELRTLCSCRRRNRPFANSRMLSMPPSPFPDRATLSPLSAQMS